jgi:hypothetical protein
MVCGGFIAISFIEATVGKMAHSLIKHVKPKYYKIILNIMANCTLLYQGWLVIY